MITHVEEAITKYGEYQVEKVYETSYGDMTLVLEKNKKKKTKKAKGCVAYGLVQLKTLGCREWEYGPVDIQELETATGPFKTYAIWKEYLPCSLKRLMHETMLYTNFERGEWVPRPSAHESEDGEEDGEEGEASHRDSKRTRTDA